MILQRLASAIRKQNWPQIITEIFIVVIGIFLGLQVQAWYDGRVALEEEERIIGYMVSDMEKSLSFLEGQNLAYDNQINLIYKAHIIIGKGVLKPEDIADFEEALVIAGRTLPLDANLNAFNDRNISQIINIDMRRTIDNYMSRVRRITRVMEALNSKMSFARRATLDAKSPYLQRINSETEIYYDFDQIKNDAEFHAAIITLNSSMVSAKLRLITMRDISRLLLQTLRKHQVGEAIEEVSFL